MYSALIACLSVVALMLVPGEAFARSGTTARSAFASTHPMARPFIHQPFHNHRRIHPGVFLPGTGLFYDQSTGQPIIDATQPPSGDVHYTYTYDVPWDWAHRFPPDVVPSNRPYVTGCPTDVVRVPGSDGAEHTVNVMRCY